MNKAKRTARAKNKSKAIRMGTYNPSKSKLLRPKALYMLQTCSGASPRARRLTEAKQDEVQSENIADRSANNETQEA